MGNESMRSDLDTHSLCHRREVFAMNCEELLVFGKRRGIFFKEVPYCEERHGRAEGVQNRGSPARTIAERVECADHQARPEQRHLDIAVRAVQDMPIFMWFYTTDRHEQT